MINGENLERAERLLSQTYQIAVGQTAQERLYMKARIESTAAEMFLKHHSEVLFRRYLPDIDPRHEPAIMTMLNHMLCVGATAQRVSEGRS